MSFFGSLVAFFKLAASIALAAFAVDIALFAAVKIELDKCLEQGLQHALS